MAVEIDIGVTGANAPAMVDLEELLATRLLVQGNSIVQPDVWKLY